MTPTSKLWYRFGSFRLCRSEGQLLCDGEPVSLSPRTFDTLAFLVEKSPQLVTVDELIAEVWQGQIIEPSNVTQHVFSARKALGDNSQNPTFIQNVPRRGYRFIAPVERIWDPMALHVADVPEHALSAAAAAHSGRTWVRLATLGVAASIALPLVALLPVAPPEIKILRYQQLTHDGGQKEGPLVTDGRRIIYRTTEGVPRQWAIPVTGGEAVPVGATEENASGLFTSIDNNAGSLWSRPLQGGEGRFVAAGADSGSWSPDGKRLAAASIGSISIREGQTARAEIAVNGQAWAPRWSPDGNTIRFSVLRPSRSTIWEVNADGGNLHQLSHLSGVSPMVDNGIWDRTGRLFFFAANNRGLDDLWVTRERRFGLADSNSKPVPFTNGPGDWRWPAASKTANRLYAIHTASQPQLSSLDPTSKTWHSIWQGAPAYEMDFSRDGRWVVFANFPDHTLWKARADGTGRVQLTKPDVEAHQPRWSPDAGRISFMGRHANGDWRAQIMPAGGGPAEDVVPNGADQGVPTWSPDGRAVIFGDRGDLKPGKQMNVHYVDLKTRKMTDLPNSYGLWSPRWSPDGKQIAAISYDSTNLTIASQPGGEWKTVLRMRAIDNATWSADSRYIYFNARQLPDCWELYRWRVADGALEMVVDLKNFRWPPDTWFGITPQGTPLALYETSPQEVFAIDYEVR